MERLTRKLLMYSRIGSLINTRTVAKLIGAAIIQLSNPVSLVEPPETRGVLVLTRK